MFDSGMRRWCTMEVVPLLFPSNRFTHLFTITQLALFYSSGSPTGPFSVARCFVLASAPSDAKCTVHPLRVIPLRFPYQICSLRTSGIPSSSQCSFQTGNSTPDRSSASLFAYVACIRPDPDGCPARVPLRPPNFPSLCG